MQRRLRLRRQAWPGQTSHLRGWDQYAILRLKRSKTDTDHTEVQIILAATGEPTCPVATLRRLFIQDPHLPNASPFRLQSLAFSRQAVLNILNQCIAAAVFPEANYSGHNFRKGETQHATDHGMLDESIQRLGCWTSNAFKLYFTSTPETLFNLNLNFQKGMPLEVLRATVHGSTVTAMRGIKPWRQVSFKSWTEGGGGLVSTILHRASLRSTTLATASAREEPSSQPTTECSTRVSRGWAVGPPTPSSSTLPPPTRHCSTSISTFRTVFH